MIDLPGIAYKNNGIPILSKKQIDVMTEDIVRKLMPQNFEATPDATDLQCLWREMAGWHYAGRYLSRDGVLLGLTSFHGGTIFTLDESRTRAEPLRILPNTILVDKGLYDPHYEHMFRFTFAHEVGHALLHRKFCADLDNMKAYAEQGSIRAIQDTRERFAHTDKYRLQTERDWLEWQANAFASAILMPVSLVDKVAEMLGVSKGKEYPPAKRMYFDPILTELTDTVADVLNVSSTAAFFRAKELSYVPQGAKLINMMVAV